jgi:hypothetical protein
MKLTDVTNPRTIVGKNGVSPNAPRAQLAADAGKKSHRQAVQLRAVQAGAVPAPALEGAGGSGGAGAADHAGGAPGDAGREAAPLLRLWLGGYHTPSLNKTKGGHWSQYHGLKKEAAGRLLEALQIWWHSDEPRAGRMSMDTVRFAMQTLGRIALGAKVPLSNSPSLQVSKSPLLLSYTRVTTQPLDADNFAGSTKAITDLLVTAFPSLLPDDSAQHVIIEHRQERCGSRVEGGTWVVVERIRND